VNFDLISGAANDADPNAIVDADPGSIIDADPNSIIDAGGPDASTQPDATPTVAEVQLVGSGSCASPSSVVNIENAGVALGNIASVQVVRRATAGTVTATDTQGNVYTQTSVSGGNGTRIFLLQSTVTSALTTADSITITESNPAASAISVSEIRNVTPAPFSMQTGEGGDGTISLGFTSQSPGVVLCSIGTRAGEVAMGADWNELIKQEENCGGNGDVGNASFWIAAGHDGITSCDATIILATGLKQWAGVVTSYADQ